MQGGKGDRQNTVHHRINMAAKEGKVEDALSAFDEAQATGQRLNINSYR